MTAPAGLQLVSEGDNLQDLGGRERLDGEQVFHGKANKDSIAGRASLQELAQLPLIGIKKGTGAAPFGTTPARCDGCKPDSVRPDCSGMDGHFSQEFPANWRLPPVLRRMRRYPGSCPARGSDDEAGGLFPCFVLHRIGFFVPLRSLAERWALTPPIHPYPSLALGAVCFL